MEQLTPPGVAGVACVLATAAERDGLLRCLRSVAGGPVALSAGGPPVRAQLVLGGKVIDDALVLDRGERGLELHLHGAPAVLESLAAAFPLRRSAPALPAHELQREAMSLAQLDLALEQSTFDFEQFVVGLRAMPLALRAVAVAAARERSRIAMALATPQRLVLVGAQNAGKSTLFNRLLFAERVLTGSTPGLTRDPVCELTTLVGYPYEVVDTAGAGEFANELEARAFALGQELRDGALVALVVDGRSGPSAADRALVAACDRPTVFVANKRDLMGAADSPPGWPGDWPLPMIASATEDSAVTLRQRLGAHLLQLRGLPPAGPVGGVAALDQVQFECLRQLEGEAATSPL